MTRINGSIKPKDLIDQHLIAEYREIVRIPNVVRNKEVDIRKIPASFRLGTGHVLYFYNKIKFLHKRFISLKQELDIRLIINRMEDEMFRDIPISLYHDISENDLIKANDMLVTRLIDRISDMKRKPTIHGKEINKDEYFKYIRETYELGNTKN